MKKITFFMSAICACTIAFGQVKVQNGSLRITPDPTIVAYSSLYIKKTGGSNVYYGVYSQIDRNQGAPYYDCIGVYGYSKAPNTPNNYPSVRTIGVMGKAEGGSSIVQTQYSIGVAGLASLTGGHIGVYGGSNLPSSFPLVNYAGYFSGNVYVTGQLSAATLTQTSDERLKQNIRSISNDVSNLMLLNPVLYNLKQIEKLDTLLNTRGGDSIVVAKRYEENSQEFQKIHYGLLAQELQQVYPDLVYEGGDGYLEINYTGLIPILVSSIQELNEKINTLEKELNSLTGQNNSFAKSSQQGTSSQEVINEKTAVLFQNTPNPFNENTEIAFYLPKSIINAMICVYDMNGKQLSQNIINERGKSVFIVNGNQYSAGMYLYSLIADNQLIDTKRMVLTK